MTEDQIGLDKGQRRDVQRRLTGLGFDTKVNGKFDDNTRAVITRWQAARGYPKSGFLNKLQHKALLTEIVATTTASSSDDSDAKPSRRRRGGGWRRGSLAAAVAAAPVASSAAWSAEYSGRSSEAGAFSSALRRGNLFAARQDRRCRFPQCINGTFAAPRERLPHFAGLFPRRLAQGVVDAVLPARAAFLEVFENVLIDPQ